MNKKAFSEKFEYYKRKKFPLSKEYFQKTKIVDREYGYDEYEYLTAWKCFGIGLMKSTGGKVIVGDITQGDIGDRTNIVGFGNERGNSK